MLQPKTGSASLPEPALNLQLTFARVAEAVSI